ncbi:hypothetical protein M8818_007751 [Zalaria obscura]|uniref:Uncharacterized protein n=1 Tax=Zalaria obscura TaxID=2024903 RepID=A0ACC3S2K8_9PEZI
MEYYKDDYTPKVTPEKKLVCIIVGAGIAGLATGIGRWGILPDIMKHFNLLERNSLRRWQNNEELGAAPLMPKVAELRHRDRRGRDQKRHPAPNRRPPQRRGQERPNRRRRLPDPDPERAHAKRRLRALTPVPKRRDAVDGPRRTRNGVPRQEQHRLQHGPAAPTATLARPRSRRVLDTQRRQEGDAHLLQRLVPRAAQPALLRARRRRHGMDAQQPPAAALLARKQSRPDRRRLPPDAALRRARRRASDRRRRRPAMRAGKIVHGRAARDRGVRAGAQGAGGGGAGERGADEEGVAFARRAGAAGARSQDQGCREWEG